MSRGLGDVYKRQVRSCANYPGLGPEWYRTAVRTAPENARLLELMKEVLG
mgnify:CR=1 FL=1